MFRLSRTIIVVLLIFQRCWSQQLHNITIGYPNGSSNWPLFVALDGGYYEHYDLNVTLTFSPHPEGIALLVSDQAQVLNYSLDQMLTAASKDGSLVVVSSLLNRGTFALMAWTENRTIQDLKGKRIGIGQIGDANYGYTAILLVKAGMSVRDVEWIPLGPTSNARVAALLSHRIDAALLTAPSYFSVNSAKIRTLATFTDRDDVYASTALVMSKRLSKSDPELVRSIIKAQAEAVKRFYADKEFAVRSFLRHSDAANQNDVSKLYDLYSKYQAFERIPFVLEEAVEASIRQQTDAQIATRMRSYDFHSVIDNSAVDELVRKGFFKALFGPGIQSEESRKALHAFGRR